MDWTKRTKEFKLHVLMSLLRFVCGPSFWSFWSVLVGSKKKRVTVEHGRRRRRRRRPWSCCDCIWRSCFRRESTKLPAKATAFRDLLTSSLGEDTPALHPFSARGAGLGRQVLPFDWTFAIMDLDPWIEKGGRTSQSDHPWDGSM